MEIPRESVIITAIRSFCKTFCGLIGIFVAIFIGSLFYALFSSPYQQPEKTTVNILPDLNRNLATKPVNSPVILQINIHGVIGTPTLDTKTIDDILLDSHRGILTGRVKAILLHFNTPGGTVIDADNIYRMLKTYKETINVPMYGYINGYCASGGVFISSVCDKLFASPPSVIGAVGVIVGPFFNVIEGLNRIGVQAQTLTSGPNKDMMNPFRPWGPDESASIQEVLDSHYQRFIDVVTGGRPMLSREKLIHEYGAKIFDVTKAQEFGYIDSISSYEDALVSLMHVANIDPQHPYQVVELVPRASLFSLFGNSKSPIISGKIEHEISFSESAAYKIRDPFAYLYLPGGGSR